MDAEIIAFPSWAVKSLTTKIIVRFSVKKKNEEIAPRVSKGM